MTSAPPPLPAAPQTPQRPLLVRFPWLQAAVIVLCGVVVYCNSFRGPFIFDDDPSIKNNPTITHLWPLGTVLLPHHASTSEGRPVVNLSLAVNYALGGLNVFGYHAFNLMFHVLAGLTLFGVVRRTLLLPTVPQHLRDGAAGVALAIALLWLVHPLQTESVVYVIQRAESLVGIFYLLTLYCVIRGAAPGVPEAPGPQEVGAGVGWYAAAVIACAIGMACKEVMATAPLVVVLYDLVFLSRSLRELVRRRWGLYVGLAATWLLLGGLIVSSGGHRGTVGFLLGVRWRQYAQTQAYAIIMYLGLCFWPRHLVLDYGFGLVHHLRQWLPQAILIGALLIGSAAALYGTVPILALENGDCPTRRSRGYGWIGFLGLSVFAILAPTSSIVPVISQTMAEHRMYLPLAAVITLVVILAYEVLHRLNLRGGEGGDSGGEGPRLRRVLAVSAVSLAVVLLSARTLVRNADYHTAERIWQQTIRDCPDNPRAYACLGAAYRARGADDAALAQFDKAIQVDPIYGPPYCARGGVYEQRGHLESAIDDYTHAIRWAPNWPEGYLARGNAWHTFGKDGAALKDFDEAVRLAPNDAKALYARAAILLALREYDRARAEAGRVIEMDPGNAAAYQTRGDALAQTGQPGPALADYDKALSLRPTGPEAAVGHNNRGCAYQALGRHDAALRDFAWAMQLKPDYAEPYNSRAVSYLELRRYAEAWDDIHTYIRMGGTPDPKFLDQLRQASGRTQ